MHDYFAIVWLAGIVAAIVVLSYVVTRLSVQPPRYLAKRTPSELGLEGEMIEFESLDGLKMRGWWIGGHENPRTIILCHGHAMSHGMMLRYTPFLHAAGFNLVLFDFRGRGRSEGDGTTIGFHEVSDLMGAVRFVKEKKGQKKIGVFGVSMGGAVAIRAAAVCPDIDAVATEAAYARLTWGILGYLILCFGPLGILMFPFTMFFGRRLAGFHPELAAPVEFVSRISPRPVLVIHGKWDTMIWPCHARQLFEEARQPKQLWLVPRAWHAAAYRVAPLEFESRLKRFFDAALTVTYSSSDGDV